MIFAGFSHEPAVRLAEEGYDFELNLDETGGVAYAEVHFKTLTRKSAT